MNRRPSRRTIMDNHKAPGFLLFLSLLLAAAVLVFGQGGGGGGSPEGKTAAGADGEPGRWQLAGGEAALPEVLPAGFDGLSFLRAGAGDDSAFFRLTEDSETGIYYGYVPAEFNGALAARMNAGESLRIRRSDGPSGESSGDEESGSDRSDTDSEGMSGENTPGEENSGEQASGQENSEKENPGKENPGKENSGRENSGRENSGKNGKKAGKGRRPSIPGTFRSGDELPSFEEGARYSFTMLDADGEKLESAEAVFYYTKNVPSMFVQTQSGSMKAIDSDKKHETSEEGFYRIYLTDGSPDAGGRCKVKGRGNSTWSQKKRPYNLNLEAENVLLGMESCRKYALIANFWDSTQTRQYYGFLAAERLGLAYTPQTRFVNLYLNGRYQSLYLLTQRLKVDGGTVKIADLDKANKKASPLKKAEVESVVVADDGKKHKSIAFDWKKEPADGTGGYLLEFQDRYKKTDTWFETETLHISFKSPEMPTVGEYEYISEYVREAEKALFSDDWTNHDTGLSCFDYFDMDSWARMYLIQDFFVQSDDEYYSFYFYKDAQDPLLYCGPVWDFDLCLGNMNCGDYYKTSARTLWLRDGRKRWLHRMDQHPEFRRLTERLYLEELEPVIRDILENEYDQTADLLEADTKLNYLRWHKDLDYRERAGLVRTLLEDRVQFLHDYYSDPDSFHRLLYHFPWGDFSYYVRDGESMGFLPTSDYGEKQTSQQREAHGRIVAWQDADGGSYLEPDEPIRADREFDPVTVQE